MDKEALIIVDLQNDFCPGGTLAVPKGNEVVPTLNMAVDLAKENKWGIYATRDWHPKNSDHFLQWPVHCLQNTKGAEFHPDLNLKNAIIISKGMDPDDLEGYSGMRAVNESGITLHHLLQQKGVKRLFIGGLALDYCVKSTALEAAGLHYDTYVIQDACRSVNLRPGDEMIAIGTMLNLGVKFVNFDDLKGRERLS